MIGWLGLDYKPLTMLWSVSVSTSALFPEKMTSLEMLDMYLIIVDVFNPYLRLGWPLEVRNIQG